MGPFLKGRKTAQLRSKTASSTNAKSRSVSRSEKRLNLLQNSLFDTTLFSQSLVTSWLLRSHFAVTSRSLRSLRGHYGHYAVTTVTTQ